MTLVEATGAGAVSGAGGLQTSPSGFLLALGDLVLPVATSIDHPVWLILAGLVAGILGGMLGIGGGILAVPALIYAAGLGERAAVATSLAAMVPMSIAAAARHHHYGNLRLKEGLLLGVLGIAGAAVGATIAEVIPESVLRASFGLLMLAIAAQMLHGVWTNRRAPSGVGPADDH